MVRLTNRYLQEEHQETQGGTLLSAIDARGSGRIAFECDCRAKLVFESAIADRASRHLLKCGVCGKGFAWSGY